MRCGFCGWDSPALIEKCEKCGKPLSAESSQTYAHECPTIRQHEKGISASLKETVRERNSENQMTTISEAREECPECGYTLEDGICPSCGHIYNSGDIENTKTKHMSMNGDIKKTVRPHRKGQKEGRFILTPISEDNGQPEGDAIQYDGNEVALSRENTDPRNSTITSQQQAIITYDDGRWNIMDQSEYKTTFVQAARKIELQSGDLILIGNQLYRFTNITD